MKLLKAMGAPQDDLPHSYEEAIDLILEKDPNASGFMRGPVKGVFIKYPKEVWEKWSAACPSLSLDEFRAIRLYTENYYRELNGSLRSGFPFRLDDSDDRSWTYTRLFWWIHQGIRKIGSVQPHVNTIYRWHKPGRWAHWNVGDVYETSAFMSTAGASPNVTSTQYGRHFGDLLLKINVRGLPKGFMADVSELSKFDKEGEVLLIPWLRFAVQQVRDLDADEQREWQASKEIQLEFVGLRTAF
eukprot:EG_transcript_24111